jgi:hypothetical protein
MVQPRDEIGFNRGSGGGVVFANKAAVVRYEEGVFIDGESVVAKIAQPNDEATVNRISRGGVIFAYDPRAVSRSVGDIEMLCVGVSWHGQKHDDSDNEWVKGAQKRPQI